MAPAPLIAGDTDTDALRSADSSEPLELLDTETLTPDIADAEDGFSTDDPVLTPEIAPGVGDAGTTSTPPGEGEPSSVAVHDRSAGPAELAFGLLLGGVAGALALTVLRPNRRWSVPTAFGPPGTAGAAPARAGSSPAQPGWKRPLGALGGRLRGKRSQGTGPGSPKPAAGAATKGRTLKDAPARDKAVADAPAKGRALKDPPAAGADDATQAPPATPSSRLPFHPGKEGPTSPGR